MILVALSGGVDSATAAALLVEAGEEVVAVSMRLYDAAGSTASVGGRCCGPRDLEDARKVCAHLGIPFYVADYEDEFRARVVDDFVAEYLRGHTPNPCVRCNQHIKFTPLMQRARALGATALATGHYARLTAGADGVELRRARDATKDQSYFLALMPTASLRDVRFPLGDLTKDEVRAHARRLGLPNSDKPESQEICFVPDGDYAGFVAAHAGAPPPRGDIVDVDGKVLAQHDGVHRFTVGQRRGIRVAGLEARYVVGIDAERAEVKVGGPEALARDEIAVGELSWWRPPPTTPLRAHVQIRHRHAAVPATVEARPDGSARVVFEIAERAPAPGQAAVVYDGDRVVAAGIIQ